MAGLVVQVVVIAIGLTQALENLGMHTWSAYVDSALGFTLEHVLVALLIVAVGLAIGNYVGDMVRARMSTADGDVNWMAEFARGGVYVLAFTMALNQLSVGEDIVISEPNVSKIEEGLNRCEFLVCQEIFHNETTRFADVVFPASCFAEKEGVFTNSDRRVQLVRKAVDPPGQAREDWKILCDL